MHLGEPRRRRRRQRSVVSRGGCGRAPCIYSFFSFRPTTTQPPAGTPPHAPTHTHTGGLARTHQALRGQRTRTGLWQSILYRSFSFPLSHDPLACSPLSLNTMPRTRSGTGPSGRGQGGGASSSQVRRWEGRAVRRFGQRGARRAWGGGRATRRRPEKNRTEKKKTHMPPPFLARHSPRPGHGHPTGGTSMDSGHDSGARSVLLPSILSKTAPKHTHRKRSPAARSRPSPPARLPALPPPPPRAAAAAAAARARPPDPAPPPPWPGAVGLLPRAAAVPRAHPPPRQAQRPSPTSPPCPRPPWPPRARPAWASTGAATTAAGAAWSRPAAAASSGAGTATTRPGPPMSGTRPSGTSWNGRRCGSWCARCAPPASPRRARAGRAGPPLAPTPACAAASSMTTPASASFTATSAASAGWAARKISFTARRADAATPNRSR